MTEAHVKMPRARRPDGSAGRETECESIMGTMRLRPSNGCWLDVFDADGYRGNTRRLHGPADFPGLRIRERGWADQIGSLQVGPGAYVQCYDARDFDGTVLWLLPNQRVEFVAELAGEGVIDSLRLYDRPPFAHEPGYAAYMLWAASHLAKLKE